MTADALRSNPVVRLVADAACERLGARRVLLFGSRSRGTHTPQSDYDFAIEPGDAALADRRAWMKFLVFLDDTAPTLNQLDVINLSEPLNQSLRDEIERTGVRVDTIL
jgi:predicted nucleotidyltransferase